MQTSQFTWSPQQERIFEWFEDNLTFDLVKDWRGHVVIRARAGTGKTTVLVEGAQRTPSHLRILICAFSKIIQEELERRVGKNNPRIHAKTLHSVGLSCVRRFRENIKVSFDGDRAEGLSLRVCGPHAPDAVRRLVTKLHTLGRETAPHAKEYGDLSDIAIQFECIPDDQWATAGFDAEYVERKALEAMELAANVKSGDTIDGSDMIFLPVRNGWLTGMYDRVLVDEAQDMNTAQLEIAQGVLKPGGRMAVIGDDRQAIFGFRGADSGSIDRLKEALNAGELNLTVTRRCGKRIVELAQEIVPDFEAHEDAHEGEIDEIFTDQLVHNANAGDFILSRVNAPLVSIAMKCLKSGKRTRIMGRDIGKGLITLVNKFKARSVPEFLARVTAWEERETEKLRRMLDKATEGRKKTINAKIEGIVDQADMLTTVAEEAKSVPAIIERIELLFSQDGMGAATVITCSSVHRAKGLEADKVFVLRDTLRNYNIEEQNIAYVAITRAKKTLVWVSDTRSED